MFTGRNGLWKKREQSIIGFAGAARGTGTTFCMMMMAYFAKQVLKAKTAVVENESAGSLSSLCMGEERFSVKGIDIFREPKLLPLGYSYLFFDYGTRLKRGQAREIIPEFSDCTIKLVTASLCPWKQEELFRFVDAWSDIQGNEEWIYLVPFASQEVLKRARRKLCREIYAVAPEQEWYRMGAGNLALWEEILRISERNKTAGMGKDK